MIVFILAWIPCIVGLPVVGAGRTLAGELVLLLQVRSPLLLTGHVVGEAVAVSDLLPRPHLPASEAQRAGPQVDPDHGGVTGVVEEHQGGLQVWSVLPSSSHLGIGGY